jgi:hypothetical protein
MVWASKRNRLFAALCLVLWQSCAAAPGENPTADAFDYFANNWNVVGLKDYPRGARVTPDNRIFLAGSNTTVQVRFGGNLTPLSRAQGKLAWDGWMPIFEIAADDGSVHYEFTYWATPLPSVRDWKQAFDRPTEGENFAVWVRYQAVNRSAQALEAKVQIRLDPGAALHPKDPDLKEPSVDVSLHGICSEARELAPGATLEGAARFAFFPIQDTAALEKEDHRVWLERTVGYWQGLEKSIATIEVPCRKATETLKAAHVCQMIANDRGEVRGGEGFYDQFYIRDGAYQVMELEEAGMWDAARKSVELFLPRQRADGRFESQTQQFDANGQALWALWQYHKITGDRAWLERVYPAMRRAADWTVKARREAALDSAFAGLLPTAPADGENLWNGKFHIVGYDFWNLRGLLCTADAARVLGKTAEADALAKEAAAYREAIDAAWQRAGLAHFPPAWEKAGTHWGNTETLWPTALFTRDDPRVGALIQHVRREFAGGFTEGTIHWVAPGEPVIHPYLSAYTTLADLIRGHDEQVVEDFYWYLLHSTAAHAFPEGIYPGRRYAWGETIPHVTGACNYAILLRHMLVHEEGDELHLLQAVPDWWLEAGRQIRVERLPTHFGEIGLLIRGTERGVEVQLDGPRRQRPARIVLRLPESRPLVGDLPGVQVVRRGNQKQRWDFPTVVAQYAKSNPPDTYSKPDAVSLTTGKPAQVSSALPAHPASLANDGFAGNPAAHWATDVQSLNDPTPWWQVDLEQPTTVGRVVVVGYYGDQRHYGFTVEGSLDGQKWSLLADRCDNQAPATKAGYDCRFEPVSLRYLRVTMMGNSANTGRHLVEVMAFEGSK